jgi:hypothetical protein
MSRLPLIMLGGLVAASVVCVVLVARPASAQTADDGCTHADPCPLIVTVDSAGFEEDGFQVTSGDWFTLTVYNDDTVVHTVRLGSGPVVVTAQADSEANSAVFQAPSPGTYTLSDSPSGDAIPLEVLDVDVVAADQVASESGAGTKGRGTPSLDLPVLACGLALLAWAARRW